MTITLSLAHLRNTESAQSDRSLFGWRVRSAIPLPELSPWLGDDRSPEVEIRLGNVPVHLEGAEEDEGPFLQIGPDGTCRFEMPAVARYLVRQGSEIVVEPRVPFTDPAVRRFLLGTVLGLLCHQRGVLPLHASCAVIAGRAVAFAGSSGTGKSVIAAALARRGCAVLADDVCAVDWRDPRGPVVLPGPGEVALWPKALEAFGLAPTPPARWRDTVEKYAVTVAASPVPMPLGTLYQLQRGKVPERITPLAGMPALLQLTRGLHATTLAQRLLGHEGMFRAAGRIAAHAVQCTLPAGDDVSEAIAAAESVLAREEQPA